MTEYEYEKESVDLSRLEAEIAADATIVTALQYSQYVAPDLHIFFVSALSPEEETALDDIVAAHDGQPLPAWTHWCRVCAKLCSGVALEAPTVCDCCGSSDIILPEDILATGVEAGEVEGITVTSTDADAGQVLTADGEGGAAWQGLYADCLFPVTPHGVALASNTSGFLLPGRADTYTATEANAQVRMPKSRIVALSGRITIYTGTDSLTLRKNGVDTAITITIGATGNFHVTGDIDFADGDLASVAFSCGPGGGMTTYGIRLQYKTEVS